MNYDNCSDRWVISWGGESTSTAPAEVACKQSMVSSIHIVGNEPKQRDRLAGRTVVPLQSYGLRIHTVLETLGNAGLAHVRLLVMS